MEFLRRAVFFLGAVIAFSLPCASLRAQESPALPDDAAPAPVVEETPEESAAVSELQISADQVEYGVDASEAIATGNVEIVYGDITLTSQEAHINQETRDFAASGDVKITIAGRGTWTAPALKGNLDAKTVEFGPFRMNSEVWHVGGEAGENRQDGNQVVHQGWMTTCDAAEPHYRIQAKKITYYPEKKTFTAKHATMRVGKVPVFYLPYLHGSTDNSSGVIIRPGYSGKRGAHLRLGRVWKLGQDGDLQFFVDGMTKRGLALGQTTSYETEEREIVTTLYGLHDQKPAETTDGYDRRFKSVEDRYRLKLYWREQITEQLSLRIHTDMLSDISMLDDWFRRDWRHWGQTKSFANLAYDGKWFHSALTVRPRVNTFYTVSEKLPEWTLDIPRLRLTDEIPLVYSSRNSAGFYSVKWRNYDRDRKEMIDSGIYNEERHRDPSDYSSFRADSLHTIQAPIDFGDFLTLTPRASIRVTAYSRTSKQDVTEKDIANWIDADNPEAPENTVDASAKYDRKGGSRTRIASELGIEGRSRLLSDWMPHESRWLEIQDMRHVIEPFFNYTYAGAPSVDRDNLYFFDEIDRLERQNFLRIGVDQFLIGRDKEGSSRSLVSLENYLDIHHREGEEDEGERHWGDFGNRLTLYPRKDLSLWGTLLHDMGEGEIHRGEVGFTYGRPEDWLFTARYTYRNDHFSRSVYSMGSSLADFTGESGYLKRYFQTADTISTQVNIPLNSITSLEIAAEYDFDKNRLSEHHYYLTRQLHCWDLVAGVGWDDSDFEVMLMLRLVAFPNVKLDMNF